jgi:DNA invertase Pin-like site-specific DNA recombinase
MMATSPDADTQINAAYVRCSSVDQGKKYGLDRQREAIERDAQREGEPIHEWFTDLESGTTEDRKEFQRLQKMVADGLVKGLRVLCVDRFARNTEDALRVARQLGQHGTLLKFVETPADLETPLGMFQFTQYASFAALEAALIRKRTIDGRKLKMSRGIPDCWILPYGYRVVNDKPEIIPEQAKVIVQIFRWRREGKSIYEISGLLTAAKIKPPRGATEWRPSTLTKLLKRRVYIGEYKRCGMVFPVPPILDRELFQEVQDLMEVTRQRTQGRPSRDYLFRGMCFCGYPGCGIRCVGAGANGYRYYRCNNISRTPPAHRICPALLTRADHLEAAAWSALWALLRDPARIRKLAEAKIRVTAKQAPNQHDPIRELANARVLETRLQQMIEKGIYDLETGHRKITALRKKMATLVMEAQALHRIVNIAPVSDIERACRAFADGPEPEGYDARRLVLEGIMDLRLSIKDGDVKITGRIPIPAAEVAPATTPKKNCSHSLACSGVISREWPRS